MLLTKKPDSIFDPYGGFALSDAIALVRAGELASRTLEEKSDQEAFASVFRAIENRLDYVRLWTEAGCEQVRALRNEAASKAGSAVRP